jgi:NodT family efflux transporter outer membrane factor (OMF) lipoprotein
MMNHQAVNSSDRPTRRFTQPWLGLLTAALMLGGCTVGPNFTRPWMQAPKAWLNQAGTTTATAARTAAAKPVELATWWRAFNDPTLSGLVERGIAANLDVKIATQRLRQARAVVGETASAWWPTVDASGSYRRTNTTSPKVKTQSSSNGGSGSTGQSGQASTGASSGGSGGSSFSQDRHVGKSLYQAGFDSAWELDIFGGTRRAVEAARADAQASEDSLRDTLVSLTAEIGTNYLALRGQQEDLRITRENLKTQQNTAEITRRQYQAGFISELDMANAEAQVATTQAQIPALEAAINQSIYQLSVLLGEEPGALLATLTPEGPLPAPPGQIPAGLPSDLLERRPDIRGAEASLHAATARIGVAIADYYPRFTLNGSLSAQASKLASWDRSVTSVASFGPSVSWNIFNGWLTHYRVEENRAVADEQLLNYRKTVLTAFQEVESNWTAFDKEIERGRSLERAVERNRRAAELARNLYTAGEQDFLNVLVAERSLLNTENALIQSRTQAAQSLIALYKALGGGWPAERAENGVANGAVSGAVSGSPREHHG